MAIEVLTPVVGLVRGITARRRARAGSLATLAESDATLVSPPLSVACDACGHQVLIPRSPQSPLVQSPKSFNSEATAVNSPTSPTSPQAPQAPFLRYRLKHDASTPILQFYLFVAQAAEGLDDWVLTDVALCHNNGRRTGGENWRSESEGYRELLVMRFKNTNKMEPVEDDETEEEPLPPSSRFDWLCRPKASKPTPSTSEKTKAFHPSNQIAGPSNEKADTARTSSPSPSLPGSPKAPRMRYQRSHIVIERNLSLATQEEETENPVAEAGESIRTRASRMQDALPKSSAISLTPSFLSVRSFFILTLRQCRVTDLFVVLLRNSSLALKQAPITNQTTTSSSGVLANPTQTGPGNTGEERKHPKAPPIHGGTELASTTTTLPIWHNNFPSTLADTVRNSSSPNGRSTPISTTMHPSPWTLRKARG